MDLGALPLKDSLTSEVDYNRPEWNTTSLAKKSELSWGMGDSHSQWFFPRNTWRWISRRMFARAPFAPSKELFATGFASRIPSWSAFMSNRYPFFYKCIALDALIKDDYTKNLLSDLGTSDNEYCDRIHRLETEFGQTDSYRGQLLDSLTGFFKNSVKNATEVGQFTNTLTIWVSLIPERYKTVLRKMCDWKLEKEDCS